MECLVRTEFWTMFLTLTGLEIVLGIDNVIFHSLTIAKLPLKFQKRARVVGMSLAVLMRFALLACILWFMSISKALLVVHGEEISVRDLVLVCGGLFLVVKSCLEICHGQKGSERQLKQKSVKADTADIAGCIVQIVILDIVFSLDSVITAVGMVNDVRAIMLAIVVSVAVMMFCSDTIGQFLQARKRLRMLAFCFIALVGAVLIAEGLDVVVPKSQIYVVGGFALVIEYFFNQLRVGKSLKSLPSLSTTSAPVVSRPRFSYDATDLPLHSMPLAYPPGSIAAAEVICRCDKPFGIGGFCLDCGDGLGVISLELGTVDYVTAQ